MLGTERLDLGGLLRDDLGQTLLEAARLEG
jgi:hypothetical protein